MLRCELIANVCELWLQNKWLINIPELYFSNNNYKKSTYNIGGKEGDQLKNLTLT